MRKFTFRAHLRIPVGLIDLKANPGRIVRHATEVRRPVLLTSRGRGVAVLQPIADYERVKEERAFMRAMVEGCPVWRRGTRSL